MLPISKAREATAAATETEAAVQAVHAPAPRLQTWTASATQRTAHVAPPKSMAQSCGRERVTAIMPRIHRAAPFSWTHRAFELLVGGSDGVDEGCLRKLDIS